MTVYARLCGWTLARAHPRSEDRVAHAAYPGGSAKFDQAIAGFAETYADQNERVYAALQNAVKEGKAEATTEIQDSTQIRSVSSCIGAAVLLRYVL
jgi:hypothetical protein